MRGLFRRKSNRKDSESKNEESEKGKPLLFFSCRELVRLSVDLMADCYSVLAETRLRDLELGEDTGDITVSQDKIPADELRQKMLRLSELLREIAQKCVG